MSFQEYTDVEEVEVYEKVGATEGANRRTSGEAAASVCAKGLF